MAIHVRKSEGNPTTIPEEIGMHYIDTLTKDVYISAGNSVLADWILVGNVTTTFTTFLSLLDTPTGTYAGEAGRSVKVNPAETALIFGNEKLADLEDVDVSGVGPVDVLVWDEDTSTWVPDSRMNWQGQWFQKTYYKHEVTRDGNYTMVANATTTDRAAPVPEGNPAWALPEIPTWTTDTDSPQAISGFRIEINGLMELSGIRFWRPTDTQTVTYDFLVLDVTNPSTPITLGRGTMPSGAVGWVTANIQATLIGPGKVIELTLTTTTYLSSTNWNHGWTFESLAGGVPTIEQLTISASHTQLNISKQADGAVDATSDLSLLKTGDEILLEEDGNVAKFEKYRVTDTIIDQGSYFEIEVVRIDNGQALKTGNLLNVIAVVNASIQPSTYTFIPNFWFSNSPFTDSIGKGFFKNDPDATTILTDNAYGIDLEGTVLDASPDWELLSLSGIASSGGGAGSSSIFLDLEDTPDSYIGSAFRMVRVNGAENRLEFSTEFVKTFNTRSGDVVPEAGDYDASDVGAYSEAETDTQIDNAITTHVGLPDPHPAYILPSELPSVSVTYYTGLTSTIDGTYLQLSYDTLGNVEDSASGSVNANDTNILIEQFLLEPVYNTAGTVLETGSTVTVDIDCNQPSISLIIEFGIRTVGTVYNVIGSATVSLSEGRFTYSIPISVPLTPFEIGDTTFIRLYGFKSSGPAATIEVFFEGLYVSKNITTVPGQATPGPHADTHEVGGSDQIAHANIPGAQGFDSHNTIDSRNDAQDTAIGDNVTAIGTKEDGLGTPAADGYILSSTTGDVRTWEATGPAHASTHMTGGNDQIQHDNITGASGHDSHTTIDTRNNSQDTLINNNAIAIGVNSGDIGDNTLDIGNNSIAIGNNTTAIGNNTTAIGLKEDDLGNPAFTGQALVSTTGGVRSFASLEPYLNNPAADGYVLSSTTGGVRSWIESGGGNPSEVIASGAMGGAMNSGTYTLTKTGNLITFNWTFGTNFSTPNAFTAVLVTNPAYRAAERYYMEYYTDTTALQKISVAAEPNGTFGFFFYSNVAGSATRLNNGGGGSFTYAFNP